jgi:predicted HTH transcriptional regulator
MDQSKFEKINSSQFSINESFIHPKNYEFDMKLKIYEDEMHEFKMFTFQDKKDLHDKINKLSKYLCAFLNSNSGVLYLGVNDDGLVKGIKLTEELYSMLEFEIKTMIKGFDDHVTENNLITYNFNNVTKDYINKEDLFVVEILVKKGLDNFIYTTPNKCSKTNDYQCFIKMNGTTKKLEGKNLYVYIKNKIKNFLKQNK